MFVLKEFLISTAPIMKVAVELPTLRELWCSYLCVAHFCLRQARQIQNETSYCQIIPNRNPAFADNCGAVPALAMPRCL